MSFSEALGMGEFRPNTKIGFEKIAEVYSTRSAFVAFEGTGDMGESTQIKLAADWVKTRSWGVVTTREPGDTNLGRQLRELLLEARETIVCEGQVTPCVETLLFAADRTQHVAELIVPALNVSKIIIDDRFMASSVAYQGQGRDLGPEEIRDLSLWATGSLTLNLTVLLNLDPEIAWERQQNDETRVSPDRMEDGSLESRRKVRARFRRLAKESETWTVVGTGLTPEEIAAQVRLHLASVLPIMKS